MQKNAYGLFLILGTDYCISCPYWRDSKRHLYNNCLPVRTHISLCIDDNSISIGVGPGQNTNDHSEIVAGFMKVFMGMNDKEFVRELNEMCTCRIEIGLDGSIRYRLKHLMLEYVSSATLLQLFFKYLLVYEEERSIPFTEIVIGYPASMDIVRAENLYHIFERFSKYTIYFDNIIRYEITAGVPKFFSDKSQTVLLFHCGIELFHVYMCIVTENVIQVKKHLVTRILSRNQLQNSLVKFILSLSHLPLAPQRARVLSVACSSAMDSFASQSFISFVPDLNQSDSIIRVNYYDFVDSMQPVLTAVESDVLRMIATLGWTKDSVENVIISGEACSMSFFQDWIKRVFSPSKVSVNYNIRELILNDIDLSLKDETSLSEEMLTSTLESEHVPQMDIKEDIIKLLQQRLQSNSQAKRDIDDVRLEPESPINESSNRIPVDMDALSEVNVFDPGSAPVVPEEAMAKENTNNPSHKQPSKRSMVQIESSNPGKQSNTEEHEADNDGEENASSHMPQKEAESSGTAQELRRSSRLHRRGYEKLAKKKERNSAKVETDRGLRGRFNRFPYILTIPPQSFPTDLIVIPFSEHPEKKPHVIAIPDLKTPKHQNWDENLISSFYINSKNRELIHQRVVNRIKPRRYRDGSSYVGAVKNNKRSGSGVLTYPDGSVYQGNFKDNMRHGKGVMRSKRGQVFFDGVFNLDYPKKGILTYNNKARYEGYFENGLPNGEGTYYANGSMASWDGQWVRGEMTGSGTFFFDNGDYYDGSLVCGKRVGAGKLCNKRGRLLFEGNYENDIENGPGIEYYPDGSYMKVNFEKGIMNGPAAFFDVNDKELSSGTFVENVFTGEGRFFFPDGTWYIGGLKENRFNGKGEYHFNGDWHCIATFVDDVCDGAIQYFYKNILVFKGDISQNMISGSGVEYNSSDNSILYQGSYLKGQRNGEGRLTLGNGKIVEATFREGEINGTAKVYDKDDHLLYTGSYIKNCLNGNITHIFPVCYYTPGVHSLT